jgi:hypothetical protein
MVQGTLNIISGIEIIREKVLFNREENFVTPRNVADICFRLTRIRNRESDYISKKDIAISSL